MNEKPEALRLADGLISSFHDDSWVILDAAAELRRQHAEIERLREALLRIKETKVFVGAIAQAMMDEALQEVPR
jgi:hypothetical protein